MKNFLLLISLCLCSAISNAKTYYISPTGNDNNAGTLAAPFKTWERISAPRWSNLLLPGDIVYIRGGTYMSSHTNNGGDGQACYWQSIVGTASNYITIQNYPGEHPILDCSNVLPYYSDPAILYIRDCSYLKVKGLEIKNLAQISTGLGVSRGCVINNCNFITMELMDLHHVGGYGYNCVNSNDITYNYCDAHECADNLSKNNDGSDDSFENANGFDKTNTTSTRITYNSCRAWLISDDGFENFLSDGISTYNNCWAFLNGYYRNPNTGVISLCRGNGEGFKLGPTASQAVEQTKTRFLNNCVAFDNKSNGFNQNGADYSQGWYTTLFQLYNCTAFRNGSNGFEFSFWEVSPGFAQILKNNLAYANGGESFHYCAGLTNVTNNSWLSRPNGCDWTGNMAITNASFQTIDTAGTKGARQSDGSLPFLNFLRPASNSIVLNAGVNVGLSFVSTAPDMGAFEYGATPPVPVTLVDFSAAEKNGKTLLQWATVTEINSSHFEVERSNDGRNYESIGNVNANGNSNIRIDYQLTDYFPTLGVNYYRLKIVDKDGQFEYSKIVSVNFRNNANTGSFEIKSALFNNKTLQVNVSSSKQQTAVLGLYDASGRVMFVVDMTLQKGVNNINKVVSLASAVYYLKLKTNEELITLPLFNQQ